jgi:hypothetical protein
LTVGARVSVWFRVDPISDICRAILQLDTLGLAPRQEFDGIAVDERHVSELQPNFWAPALQTQQPLQLGNVFDLDSAT